MPLPLTTDPLPITNTTPELTAQAANIQLARVSTASKLAGGLRIPARTITSDSPVSSTDGVVYADTTAAGVTATLFRASQYSGSLFGFKRVAGANTFTVQVGDAATELIGKLDGTTATSITVTAAGAWLHNQNATTWQVMP